MTARKSAVRLTFYAYRPLVTLRRNAINKGIFGKSLAWRVVAIGLLSSTVARRAFGKHSELISRQTLRPGSFASIAVTKPLSRRQRKRQGITLAALRSQARADVNAAKQRA